MVARIRNRWNNFRNLLPLLNRNGLSLRPKGKFNSTFCLELGYIGLGTG